MIEISGKVTGIKFRNKENGWSVFTVAGKKAITCTGILPELAAEKGAEVVCSGGFEYFNNKKQLKCEKITVPPPDIDSEEGVVRLLEKLPGIGPKKAAAAVSEHGYEKAWEYACKDPEKIGVPAGLAEKATGIAESLIGGYAALVYLLGIGLTDKEAEKITAFYRSRGIQPENIPAEHLAAPYLIMQIDGFGFLKSDAIALKAGIGCGHPARISAAIQYALDDSEANNGNIWINGQKLCNIVKDLLEKSATKNSAYVSGAVDFQSIRKEVYSLSEAGKVKIDDDKRVFSRRLLNYEKTILEAIGGGTDDF